MAGPGRTQKQIAERYKGNLGYYNKKHLWRRARFWVGCVILGAGLLAAFLYERGGREVFFSAGTISDNHATLAENCASCHDNAVARQGATFASWPHRTLERFRGGIDFAALDRHCEQCHQQHTLHEPNVVQNRSCSACHQEHQGPGSMKLVSTSNCLSCHQNAGVMEASAQKGAQIPPREFHLRTRAARAAGQRVVFELPRPARGYTEVFSSFAAGHPEFQLDYEKARDPDVLRFNHQRHEAADIPQVQGRRLDCNFCHKPDLAGRYYQRVSFAANCQTCHSLQFDAKNPELTLPHGDPNAIRGFLQSLPAQYAQLATRRGLVRQMDVQNFVARQMTQLRERVRSGQDFERQIFFTTNPYKAQPGAMTPAGSSFYGCAFCHEVKLATAQGPPAITKPIFVDRWMPQAKFDHAKHLSVRCTECHRAGSSTASSDVLIPAKADCVTCHSPKGKVVAECITCHTYHATPATSVAAASPERSFKEMLLGAR